MTLRGSGICLAVAALAGIGEYIMFVKYLWVPLGCACYAPSASARGAAVLHYLPSLKCPLGRGPPAPLTYCFVCFDISY